MHFKTLVLVFFLFTATAFAEEMKFAWPVECTLGQNCWIVNYVDADPSKKSSKDFQCGDMTYEGHDGTDIAIKDHNTIADSIGVLAAADGEVLRIRNSEDDGDGNASLLKVVKRASKECGNGVIIAHGEGWETNYCHMKKGSIVVKPGQHVHKGDQLGAVGQSGLAEFPHLHFGVKHNHTVIDPFTSTVAQGCKASGAASLWDKQIAYNPVMLYAAGLSDHEPVYAELVNDVSSQPHILVNAPILTFWVLFYGAQPGDRIEMKILDPEGNIYVQNEDVLQQKKIRMMRYVGTRTQNKPLHAGTYTGEVTLFRAQPDGQIIERKIERVIAVERIN